MKQFIQSRPESLQQLGNRARNTCIRYRSQELPPGSDPSAADVGFEIDPQSNRASLHVQRGVLYAGSNVEIAEWYQSGSKIFSNFDELVRWLHGPLKMAFSEGICPGVSSNPVAEPDRHQRPTSQSLTNLPAVMAGVQESQSPDYIDEESLRSELLGSIRGQDHSIRSLASVVARHCARRHPKRPAVLFAVGPSGVGKTRSAEVLAEALSVLDSDSVGYQFLRLDMSEYQEAHRVSQLIGSPQGYLGHGEGSQLLDTLSANPKCIVLFDEIEKAHPAILKVLMNAMDAGRLSSASKESGSHEVDCRQAIFLFTSNLDAKAIIGELEARQGFGNKSIEDEVCRRRMQASGIPTEIVGRIGRFLVFRPLDARTRAEIMAGTIVDVAAEYGICVTYVEPDVIVELMKTCRSDGFGMRPGQFMIDEALGDAFVQAAKSGSRNFRVVGSPYNCVPVIEPNDSPSPPLQVDSITDSTTQPEDTSSLFPSINNQHPTHHDSPSLN